MNQNFCKKKDSLEGCSSQQKVSEILSSEANIKKRIDENGKIWTKVYFGSGEHFKNWLEQCIEIYGKNNVTTDEVKYTGLSCYELSGEKVFRIWVKKNEAE